MNKLAFFLLALRSGAYTKKDWVIKCFSYFIEQEGEHLNNPYPYRLFRLNGKLAFLNPLENDEFEEVEITDSNGETPLLDFKEPVALKPGDLPNLGEDLESSYGRLFVNYAVLIYAFGSKIPYQNTEIFGGKIEKEIEAVFESDLAPGQKEDPTKIYVHEYKKFAEAMFQLGGYNSLCVPSASPKSLTSDPKGRELRDKLLAENKDRLHDPAVIARIQKQLELLDREWVDDDARDFFLKSKAYTDTRMKAHYMHGLEKPFSAGDKSVLIKNSLTEGWDFKNLTAMANSLREGSFNRGSETQLGGVAAKEAFRAFQNVSIAEKDCGSTLGMPFDVTDFNRDMFVGFYHVTRGGIEEITTDISQKLVGGKIYVRIPMLCKTSHTDFCEVCMGKKNSLNPTGLNALGADVGSTFLQAFMKKMHVSSLSLARYRPRISIQ